MTRTGTIGTTITLGVKFYDNGNLFDPYSIDDVGIYSVAIALPATTLYDQWSWVAVFGMLPNVRRYSFTITEEVEEETPDNVVSEGSPFRDHPTWIHRPGVRRVEDVGNGIGVIVEWEEARPVNYERQVHYNLYRTDTRFGVFENGPYAITTSQNVIVSMPAPGNVYYLAVRATEFDTDIDITELEATGLDLYLYPSTATLLYDLPETEDGYLLEVDSVEGFPSIGELLIDTELMRYTAIDYVNNTFTVAEDDRAILNTFLSDHSAGADVDLWHGIEELNTIIRQGVAAWHDTVQQLDAAIGDANADTDGYRVAPQDNLTTDLSTSDENTEDAPHFDYCGYHRPSIQESFSGACVGSYLGGEFGGHRGFNFQDRIVARLDAMLQATGENMILLRRKWTGKRCRCTGIRRESIRTRCPYCYGTGFTDGFDRFVNPRAVSESFTNTPGFIKVRVSPFKDDLQIQGDQGLTQDVNLIGWTLVYPTMKDRDLLIRYNEGGSEEFRYEVQNVTRNRLMFGIESL